MTKYKIRRVSGEWVVWSWSGNSAAMLSPRFKSLGAASAAVDLKLALDEDEEDEEDADGRTGRAEARADDVGGEQEGG